MRVSATALTVALTGVTAYEKVSIREILELPDIPTCNIRRLQIGAVCLASYIPYIVRPNDIESRPHQRKIAATASAEK
jgi:hypothetical protein